MKNKILASVLCVALATGMVACGSDKKTEGTETSEPVTQSAGITSDKRSGEFDIDVTKQVTNLADYNEIPVTLSADYEVTEKAKNEYLTQLLTTYGADAYKEVTDRTVVQEGDYVKVDYTGYLDGEAFDGGAAEDVLLDVSNNCAVAGNGFIDGFTSGIIGGKVGETVSSDVTFPEEYQAENLAGQLTTFEFNIKAIYSDEPITMDELTDEQVADIFTEAGITTVADFEKAVEADLKQQAYSATVNEVKAYMIDNSTVEIPQDYLTARVAEFEASFAKDNCAEGQTLEDLLTNTYGISLEEAEKTWTENITEQIKTEFIFGYIAKLENIEFDEEAYQDYIAYIVEQGGADFTDDAAVYEYFGSGNAEEGEAYLRNQYLVNKAIDFVAETASVSYMSNEADDSDETSNTEAISEDTEAISEDTESAE